MLYLSLFLSTAFLSIFSFVREDGKAKIIGGVLFSFLFVYLVCFAGLRAPDIAPDYVNYINWLYRVGLSLNTIVAEFKDPGFLLTFSLVHWLGFPDFVFFCLVAYISLQAKFYFSKTVFLGCFTYLLFFLIFSRFFIVHDMVQVRVGSAIALASCAIILFFRGESAKAVVLYAFGLSFHLSVIIFLPFFFLIFLNFRKISRLNICILLVSSLALSSIISGFSSQLSEIGRLAPYLNGEYKTASLSLFSFYVIIRILLVLSIILFFYESLSDIEHFVLFMSTIGLALQLLLSWNDSFSLRTAELFGMFDMACFVMLMRLLNYPSKVLYGVLLFGIAAVFYIASLRIIDDYASVLS